MICRFIDLVLNKIEEDIESLLNGFIEIIIEGEGFDPLSQPFHSLLHRLLTCILSPISVARIAVTVLVVSIYFHFITPSFETGFIFCFIGGSITVFLLALFLLQLLHLL